MGVRQEDMLTGVAGAAISASDRRQSVPSSEKVSAGSLWFFRSQNNQQNLSLGWQYLKGFTHLCDTDQKTSFETYRMGLYATRLIILSSRKERRALNMHRGGA